MADDFRTNYTFHLRIEGQEAKTQAETFRDEIAKILASFSTVGFDKAMDKATARATKASDALNPLDGIIKTLNKSLSDGVSRWTSYAEAIAKASHAAQLTKTQLAGADKAVTKAAVANADVIATQVRQPTPQPANPYAYGLPQISPYDTRSEGVTVGSTDLYGLLGKENAPTSYRWGVTGKESIYPSIAPPSMQGPTGTWLDAKGQIMPQFLEAIPGFKESAAGIDVAEINKWSAGFGGFSEKLRETTSEYWAFRRIGYDFEHMGRKALTVTAAWATAMYGLSQSYIEFDSSATRAAMAMRLQPELVGQLRESIRETSIESAAFSPEQIAEGLRLWAAGTGEVVRSGSQLNRMMDDTVAIQRLAAVNNVDFAQTVDDVGGIMHEYGMQTKDVGRITDVLNYVSSESFANVNDLGQAFKMVGPLANQLGISFETTASALAMLSDNNVKGTMAGRAFRQILIKLVEPTDDYTKAMNQVLGVNEAMGESWKDIVFPGGQFVGLAEYFDIVAAATENMTDSQKAEFSALVTTANAIPAYITMLNNQNEARKYGVNAMRAYEKVMNGVNDAEVIAYKAMYQRITGLPFTLEGAHARMSGMWKEFETSDTARMMRLQNRWRSAIIGMGEPLTDVLIPILEDVVGIVERVSEIVENNPGLADLAVNLLAIAGGFAALMTALGTTAQTIFMIQSLGPALKSGKNAFIAAGAANAATRAAAASSGAVAAASSGAAGAAGAAAGAGLVPIVLSVLSAAAVVATILSIATRKNRLAINETIEDYSPEAQSRFRDMFKLAQTGRAVPMSNNAAAFVRQMAAEGVIQRGRRPPGGSWSAPAARHYYELSVEEVDAIMARIVKGIRDAEDAADNFYNLAASSMSPQYMPTLVGPFASLSTEDAATIEANNKKAQEYLDYEKAKTDILAQFADQRKDIEQSYLDWYDEAVADSARKKDDLVADSALKEQQALEELGKSLSELQSSYSADQVREEEDLQGSITEAIDNANKTRERNEKSHLETLRNLQTSHAERMVDLLEARDVQGITKEMRSYKNQVAQQNRSYASQQEDAARDLADRVAKLQADARKKAIRAEEDYNQRRAEMVSDYKYDAAQREKDLERSLKEEDKRFRLADEQRKKDRNESLGELRKNQTEALLGLQDDLFETLTAVDISLNKQYQKLLDSTQTFLDTYVGKWRTAFEMLETLLSSDVSASSRMNGLDLQMSQLPPLDDNYGASSGVPSRAAGGYVDGGLYNLHPGEFVLSPQTTKELEGRYGHLNQQSFKMGGGQAVIFSPTFHGMGAQDKAWYLKAASDMFDEKMHKLTKRVRG